MAVNKNKGKEGDKKGKQALAYLSANLRVERKLDHLHTENRNKNKLSEKYIFLDDSQKAHPQP